MAVAILIFSNGDPLRMLLGCLLFGFADAFSLRLQTLGYPSYLVLAVPYLVALAALFALSYRARPKIIRETARKHERCVLASPKSSRPVPRVPQTRGVTWSASSSTSIPPATTSLPCCLPPPIPTSEARRRDHSNRRRRADRAGHQRGPQHAVAGRPGRHSGRMPAHGGRSSAMPRPTWRRRSTSRSGSRALRRAAEGVQSRRRRSRSGKANARHAVDFIIDTARAEPGEITLVTTGPTDQCRHGPAAGATACRGCSSACWCSAAISSRRAT